MKIKKYNSEEKFAFLSLKEDILFDKIPKDKIDYYIKESIKIGHDCALKYADLDLIKELENLGFQIIFDSSDVFNTRALTRIGDKKRQVIIYEESINDIEKISYKYNLGLNRERIIQFHLAHEFFHINEYLNDGLTETRLDKVTYQYANVFTKKRLVRQTAEIAAHTFVQDFCKLEFPTELIEKLSLIERKVITEKEWDEEYAHAKWNV